MNPEKLTQNSNLSFYVKKITIWNSKVDPLMIFLLFNVTLFVCFILLKYENIDEVIC